MSRSIGRSGTWRLSVVLSMAGIGAFATNPSLAQTVVYVDDDAPLIPPPTGTSWAAAFPSLTTALLAAPGGAPGGAEVRVAQGTYRPAAQAAAFQLKNNVVIKGGYGGLAAPGAENQRDVDLYVTTLTGDLLGDDASGGLLDNCFHVVNGSSVNASAVLDGFTIRAGRATGVIPDHQNGGGLFVLNGSPTIRQCRLLSNVAANAGGGAYLSNSASALDQVTFDGNSAGFVGGAAYMGASAPALTGCRFSANTALSPLATLGGAVFVSQSSNPLFTSCEFSDNRAKVQGGAIAVASASNLQLVDCEFTDNRLIDLGGLGGAIFTTSSTVSATSTSFNGNQATIGGAIYHAEAPLTLTGCVLTGNTTGAVGGEGGAVYGFSSAITAVDCQFTGNTVGPNGSGGSIRAQLGPLQLRSCVFTGCAAGTGAAMLAGACSGTVSSTVFSGNTGGTGGAVRLTASTIDFLDCQFINNTGTSSAGAIFFENQSPCTLRRCLLRGNTSATTGGALVMLGLSHVQVSECEFLGNRTAAFTGGAGGAVDIQLSQPTFVNCAFAGNAAAQSGGAINVQSGASTRLINCTITHNVADAQFSGLVAYKGGGINVTPDGGPVFLSNCILWRNRDTTGAASQSAQIFLPVASPSLLRACLVHGLDALPGACNFDGTPAFIANPDDGGDGWGVGADNFGNLRLQPGSPCIDRGDNGEVPVDTLADLDGLPRFGDDPRTTDTPCGGSAPPAPVVDLGPYEYSGCASCSPLRFWDQPRGGDFHVGDHWFPALVPGPEHSAVLYLPDSYAIQFNTPQTHTAKLIVRAGDAVLDLHNNLYVASELRVGQSTSALTADLTVHPGELFALDAVVGPGNTFGSMRVLGSGAQATAVLSLQVKNGLLQVADGGEVDVLFTPLTVFPGGRVGGDGRIEADVVNFGRFEPALGATGALTVIGDYRQIGQIALLGPQSGLLAVDLNPAGHDHLAVSGLAQLGGGLIASAPAGFAPPVGSKFPILGSGQLQDQFDVALLPGIVDPRDPRFFKVVYHDGSGVAGARAGASLVVESLQHSLSFGDQKQVGIDDGLPTSAVVANLDDDPDQRADLAVAIPGATPADPGRIVMFFNDGAGGLGGGQTIVPVGRDPVGLVTGHFNADTAVDLAVANRADGTVMILVNDSGSGARRGTFSLSQTLIVAANPVDLVSGDFALGGATDLVVIHATTTAGAVQPLIGDGAGHVSPVGAPIPFSFVPSGGGSGGVQRDRHVDVVVAGLSTGGGVAGILLGAGDGAFVLGQVLPVGLGPSEIRCADLNGDGAGEIITVNPGPGTVSVLLNDGDGGFAPAVNLPVGEQPRSLALVDLDHDGDLDLAVAAVSPSSGMAVVRVLRNDLTQTNAGTQLAFAQAADLVVDGSPQFVLAGDLDGNNVTDLITVNLVNDGGGAGVAGALGPPATISAVPNTTTICNPADLNCDGVVSGLDIALLLGSWGPCPGCPADLNGSGAVNGLDLAILLGAWG